MNYWLLSEGEIVGPMSLESVLDRPGVTARSLVWTEGLPEWVRLEEVPGLDPVQLLQLTCRPLPEESPHSGVGYLEELAGRLEADKLKRELQRRDAARAMLAAQERNARAASERLAREIEAARKERAESVESLRKIEANLEVERIKLEGLRRSNESLTEELKREREAHFDDVQREREEVKAELRDQDLRIQELKNRLATPRRPEPPNAGSPPTPMEPGTPGRQPGPASASPKAVDFDEPEPAAPVEMPSAPLGRASSSPDEARHSGASAPLGPASLSPSEAGHSGASAPLDLGPEPPPGPKRILYRARAGFERARPAARRLYLKIRPHLKTAAIALWAAGVLALAGFLASRLSRSRLPESPARSEVEEPIPDQPAAAPEPDANALPPELAPRPTKKTRRKSAQPRRARPPRTPPGVPAAKKAVRKKSPAPKPKARAKPAPKPEPTDAEIPIFKLPGLSGAPPAPQGP